MPYVSQGDLSGSDLYSGFKGGWSTQLIVSTPTQPAPFELPFGVVASMEEEGENSKMMVPTKSFVCKHLFVNT